MRQRRCLELVTDYDCEILYHLQKSYFVADALSGRGLRQLYSSKQMLGKLANDMTRVVIELMVG